MTTKLDITNISLGHLGANFVRSFDSTRSPEASFIRQYYDIAKSAELETFDWSFARKFAAMEEAEDPPGGWLYIYDMPSDCLIAREVLPPGAMPTSRDRSRNPAPYQVVAGRKVATNTPDATLRYTANDIDEEFFPTNFIMAFSHRLAGYVAQARTGDPKIVETQNLMAERHRMLAQGTDGNAGDSPAPEPWAEWTRAR